MKRIFFITMICLLTLSLQAQKAETQKDYEFILMSSPSLSQEYPNNKRVPKEGGTYRSFSFDGNYAFIYNDKHCGFYDVPSELRDGFQSMVPNLQKTNATLFWERVKKVMADIDAYWNRLDSLERDKRQRIVSQYGPDDVRDIAEQMPSFPDGMGALMQYLSSNIKYPVEAVKNGMQGRVVTSFIVEKDGSISEVKVVKSVHPALDAEAVRVVKAMPKWNPGKENGKPVRVKFTLPVTFRMQ